MRSPVKKMTLSSAAAAITRRAHVEDTHPDPSADAQAASTADAGGAGVAPQLLAPAFPPHACGHRNRKLTQKVRN